MPDFTRNNYHDNMTEDIGISFSTYTVEPHVYTAFDLCHDEISIVYIRKGPMHMRVGGAWLCVYPGEVILIRSNVLYRIASADCIGMYDNLKFSPSLLFALTSEENATSYMLRLMLSHENIRVRWSSEEAGALEFPSAVNLLRQRAAEQRLPCWDIAVKLAGSELIYSILRALIEEDASSSMLMNKETTFRIYQIVAFIHHEYANPITVRQCAERVGLSYSYFSRIWKQTVGRSFKRYLNEIRVQKATQLLNGTSRSVTRIASDCGFENLSYFIACYHDIRGVTPTEERAQSKSLTPT